MEICINKPQGSIIASLVSLKVNPHQRTKSGRLIGLEGTLLNVIALFSRDGRAHGLWAGLLMWLLASANPAAFAADTTEPSSETPTTRVSVAYCSDCVPFHFTDDNGRPAGLIIDHWRLWSGKTGIAVDFRAASWDDTLRMVGAGVADAHAGLFFNAERDRFLDYGNALTKTDTHVFLHKSLPPIAGEQDLAAYRIGVIAKDFVEGFLKDRLPAANIVGYPDYDAIMAALNTGELRAFAADTPTGIFHLQQRGILANFTFPNSQRLYQNDWFTAVTEGNVALLEIINRGMALVSDEEKLEITRRWATGQAIGDDVLIIAMDRAYPPMTFLNAQGKPAGLLVDLWRLWSAKTGREVRLPGEQLGGYPGGHASAGGRYPLRALPQFEPRNVVGFFPTPLQGVDPSLLRRRRELAVEFKRLGWTSGGSGGGVLPGRASPHQTSQRRCRCVRRP